MNPRRPITRRSRPSPQAKVDKTLPVSQFDRATLAEAKKIILGESEWLRFDEEGKLVNLRPYDDPEDPERLKKFEEETRVGKEKDRGRWLSRMGLFRQEVSEQDLQEWEEEYDLSHPSKPVKRTVINFLPKKLDMALAALTLVANHEAKQSPAPTSMQLRVSSYQVDTRGLAFFADLGLGDDNGYGIGHDLRRCEQNGEHIDAELLTKVQELHAGEQDPRMRRLEQEVQSFNKLIRGEITPEEHHEATSDPYHEDERDHALKKTDPDARRQAYIMAHTRNLLDSAANIRREALYVHDPEAWMRLHNSCPEAIRFLRASEEAEFLLGHNGSSKRIEDVRSFLGSPWPHLASNIKFQVDPQILQSLRADLRGREVVR